jgi:hypothetical protein
MERAHLRFWRTFERLKHGLVRARASPPNFFSVAAVALAAVTLAAVALAVVALAAVAAVIAT